MSMQCLTESIPSSIPWSFSSPARIVSAHHLGKDLQTVHKFLAFYFKWHQPLQMVFSSVFAEVQLRFVSGWLALAVGLSQRPGTVGELRDPVRECWRIITDRRDEIDTYYIIYAQTQTHSVTIYFWSENMQSMRSIDLHPWRTSLPVAAWEVGLAPLLPQVQLRR